MDASATVRLLNVTATEDRIHHSESSSIVQGSRHQIPDEILMSQVSLGNGECLGELFHRYARTVRGAGLSSSARCLGSGRPSPGPLYIDSAEMCAIRSVPRFSPILD